MILYLCKTQTGATPFPHANLLCLDQSMLYVTLKLLNTAKSLIKTWFACSNLPYPNPPACAYQLCINFLSTFYQLFINFYQLFINFLSTFINFLSTFINFLSTLSTFLSTFINFCQLLSTFINFYQLLSTFYQLFIDFEQFLSFF